MFLACAAPFALAWAAWYFGWAPGAAGNYGELIPPRVVAGPPLPSLRGKWVLVTFDSAACDAYCEKKLYYMRQVRRAQGKDQDRHPSSHASSLPATVRARRRATP